MPTLTEPTPETPNDSSGPYPKELKNTERPEAAAPAVVEAAETFESFQRYCPEKDFLS